MVSKSYTVSKNKADSSEVFNKEKAFDNDADISFNMQKNEDHAMKNYDTKDLGFVINVNEAKREMVNIKPSKNIIFHDDNFSFSTPSSSSSLLCFWWRKNNASKNNMSMLKWNIHEVTDYINIGLLIKIIAASISIGLIGFIVSSILATSSTNLLPHDTKYANIATEKGRMLSPIKHRENDNIIDIMITDYTTSSTIVNNNTTAHAEYPSTYQTSSTKLNVSKTSNVNNNSHKNDLYDHPLQSSVLPLNTIITDASQNEHAKKSNDEISLNKNYVERINFYTTSNKNLFSVKVSPTLPSIKRNSIKPTSEELPAQNYANDCESTSLPLCQGILAYDLADSNRKFNLTNLEYEHFKYLIHSNCSNRAHEYVCHMLEPECRPTKMKNLMPCRRICKGIFESCSHIIASSEVLTQFFDCNQYIDSSDPLECKDITRSHKQCYEDEFRCGDSSCISLKWRCDNIRDCINGEDEDECKFCNYDEFKCLSDQKCISEKWRCDGSKDCFDGSDELNCDSVESDDAFDYNSNEYEEDEEEREKGSVNEEENLRIFYDDIKDYGDRVSIDNHNDSDGDKIVSTGDDVVPIIINPNSTLSSNNSQLANSSTKLSKRFRSTMRKTLETTTSTTPKSIFVKTSTSVTKSVTSSHSTSHTSPCPEDHLRCVDGLCITVDQICDKIRDCVDNSDELHCEY